MFPLLDVQYIRYIHQHSALQIRGHLSKQQLPHQAGDGRKDESATQRPGHREVISGTGPISRDTGQVTVVTWGRTYSLVVTQFLISS